mmetsp:Transcript_23811/g.61331  ORF Transcript_23811/g.61331 Transcript_23811/m.61331 type:complete len:109 (+) Transcript_23811:25-351(+)
MTTVVSEPCSPPAEASIPPYLQRVRVEGVHTPSARRALLNTTETEENATTLTVCPSCGKARPLAHACLRCGTVHYCSRSCTLRHWRESHKLECRPLAHATQIPNVSNR